MAGRGTRRIKPRNPVARAVRALRPQRVRNRKIYTRKERFRPTDGEWAGPDSREEVLAVGTAVAGTAGPGGGRDA